MALMSHCPLFYQVPKVLVSERTCAWLLLQITWDSVGQVRHILPYSCALLLWPSQLQDRVIYCHLQANGIPYNGPNVCNHNISHEEASVTQKH